MPSIISSVSEFLMPMMIGLESRSMLTRLTPMSWHFRTKSRVSCVFSGSTMYFTSNMSGPMVA